MAEKNVHVLNWEKIIQTTTANHSHRSNDRPKRNKGLLFEDLIEELLSAMFPDEKWKRTIESHDGKRDFVYPADEYLPDEKWAECKNYNTNLSINVIAPTLIMGAIENIKCILFFSYSPLNDNAIDGLLRYSKKENVSIKIFDGNLLESLICKYHHKKQIADFFPDTDFVKAYDELQKKSLRIILNLRDMNGNPISTSHSFELGERFYIQTIMQNLTCETFGCNVSFSANKKLLLQGGCVEHSISLPIAQLEEHTVLCEALHAGNASYTLKISGEHTKSQDFRQKITIIDEPYLAWSGDAALTALKQSEKHLCNQVDKPLIIEGRGGTGKSTLLEILLKNPKILEYYCIVRVNLGLSRTNFVSHLFSQLIGLNGSEVVSQDQAADSRALSFLIECYAESADRIADTIMNFYDSAHPYLFVIDDVQEMSGEYIRLFRALDSCAKAVGASIYFLLVLNNENTTVDQMLEWFTWDSNREYNLIRLAYFEKKDVLTYLKTRYGLENIDDCFDGFENSIRPLELQSFCAGLKKDRIIIKDEVSRTYQVVDRFKFSEGIRHILYAGISIKHICTTVDRNGMSEYALKYLYLTGKMSTQVSEKVIHCLVDSGILKDKNGVISFCHDEIRKGIKENLTFSAEDYADIFADANTDDSSKAICALMQIRKHKDFLESYFQSSYQIGHIAKRYNICWQIIAHLDELSIAGLSGTALQFINANFVDLREEQGYSSFWQFLKHIADSALNPCWDTDEESVECIAYFIKKFFDRSLSSYNYGECVDYFNKYVNIFTGLRHISSERRNFWLSHYANRAAIAQDRTSRPLEEETVEIAKLYELSNDFRKKAGESDELTMQIVVDEFNRHYVYRHDLTLSVVKDTYQKLQQINSSKLSDSMVLEFHILLMEYLSYMMNSEGSNDLEPLLDKVRSVRMQCNSPFYTMKLYTMEAYILIGLEQYEKALDVVSQASEYAYKKEMRQYVYKLTYIKAHLLVIQRKPGVYIQSVLALEQLANSRGQSETELLREAFLLTELVRIINEHTCDNLSSIVCASRNSNVLKEVCIYVQTGHSTLKKWFAMQSFFSFNGISFPAI